MALERLENYLTLLRLRRAARRRDVVLIGVLFALSFLALIALGMLERLAGRGLFLAAALVTIFGISFLTAWVRLEIVKELMELGSNLQLPAEPASDCRGADEPGRAAA